MIKLLYFEMVRFESKLIIVVNSVGILRGIGGLVEVNV